MSQSVFSGKDPQSVKKVMTRKLLTVELEDEVRKAYQMMKEDGIRHLPVTSPQGEIVGILSDRDVSRAMQPYSEGAVERHEPEFEDGAYVRDYMSWPVRSVGESTSLNDVARIMVNEKISAILVKSRNDRVLGIVTTQDMLELLANRLEKDPTESARTIDSFRDFGGVWFAQA